MLAESNKAVKPDIKEISNEKSKSTLHAPLKSYKTRVGNSKFCYN